MKKKEVGERKILCQNDNIQNVVQNKNTQEPNSIQQMLKMKMKE